MLGHATADIVSRSIIDSLKSDEVDITKMLMLGGDNPNVNIAIEDILYKKVTAERKKKSSSVPLLGLISIGSCPLHIIHGAFRKGFKSTAWFIDESINDIWCWFSRSSARQGDFITTGTSINETYSRFLSRHLQCLQPLARQQESSRTSIMYLSRHVPYLLTNEEIDRVGAEWRVYQMADIPEEWFRKTTVYLDHIIEYLPIDKYCYRIFSTATSTGTPQYVVLTKLVKCLLSLPHGNSDVERGFSENNHLVPDDRSSLNEASINGLRATKAAVKFFRGGKAHAVSTTSTLISNVKEAYLRYTKDNEQQQKLIKNTDVVNGKQGPEVEHERLEEKETQLINEQKNLQEELTKATNMLEEGTTRLAAAMKNKKFDDIGTTEVLVTAANAKLAVLKTKLIENDENLNRLRKKIN
ncbi:unnamed protein product [Rotaria socialis]|uniref:Uncharacterized protein n=1 Tax=Rotaria socialis TaxID=392032 RepID=A0A818XUA1_9BILA|nr:unnamed protein product [Rotaria socialis]CAF4891932.1 unnamed protein product [Rotaria socialis]